MSSEEISSTFELEPVISSHLNELSEVISPDGVNKIAGLSLRELRQTHGIWVEYSWCC